MIDLLERALRHARTLLLLSLMALTACGPGSGGTGTGPLMAFNFSGSVGGGSVGGADPGAFLALNLRIEDGQVELVADELLAFKGEWSEPGTDFVVRVPGSAVLRGETRTAVLRLEFDRTPHASSAVTLTITSADQPREVLLDPVTLARVGQTSQLRP
ncbi:MAG: hypothetical protein V4787_15760 [Pseudomonadota bacterium]